MSRKIVGGHESREWKCELTKQSDTEDSADQAFLDVQDVVLHLEENLIGVRTRASATLVSPSPCAIPEHSSHGIAPYPKGEMCNLLSGTRTGSGRSTVKNRH